MGANVQLGQPAARFLRSQPCGCFLQDAGCDDGGRTGAALVQAARQIAVDVQGGKSADLKAVTVPEVAANFTSIEQSAAALAPLMAGATITVDAIYGLDASDAKPGDEQQQFFCDAGDNSSHVTFGIQHLPPGQFRVRTSVHARQAAGQNRSRSRCCCNRKKPAARGCLQASSPSRSAWPDTMVFGTGRRLSAAMPRKADVERVALLLHGHLSTAAGRVLLQHEPGKTDRGAAGRASRGTCLAQHRLAQSTPTAQPTRSPVCEQTTHWVA